MAKVRGAECIVPGCDRRWHLRGGRQGFTVAAAVSHGSAHLQRYHEENGHRGDSHIACDDCTKATGRKTPSQVIWRESWLE